MTERRRGGGPVEWFSLTIDCHDAEALAEFYAKSLGGEITYRTADQAWVRAPGIALVCRAVADHKPTTWPSPEVPLHSHFEFVVADPDETAEEMRQ
ncbi:VOC family protein [Saccharopolyspora sp. NPDC003752]